MLQGKQRRRQDKIDNKYMQKQEVISRWKGLLQREREGVNIFKGVVYKDDTFIIEWGWTSSKETRNDTKSSEKL